MEDFKKPCKVKITGGKPLQGEIQIEVNKNAVLPTLCATMLASEDCIMHNVPRSPDVLKILQAIEEIGGCYKWNSDMETLTVNCKNLQNKPVSDCVSDIQSAILFVGPLLARFGEANVPVAIGCKLGYRGPEDHIEYLSHLGVTTDADIHNHRVLFSVDKKQLTEERIVQLSNDLITKIIIFSEASVTPTENLLMFLSCVTKFDTRIEGIAQEPHVRFLTKVLQKMGMTIIGKGNVLTTKGIIGSIRGFECNFNEEPDFVDFYGYAIMTVLTRGQILLKCSITPAIKHMVHFLNKVGIHCESTTTGILVMSSESSLELIQGFPKANDSVYKINPKPWPGFPVDCLPSDIAFHAQHGKNYKIIANNWMYEDGLSYVHELYQLGAEIKIFDTGYGSQKIEITSLYNDVTDVQKTLFGQEGIKYIKGVPVIEGTRAIISYSLQRKGVTIIEDISPILRRSPGFISKLCRLGADIEIIKE